MKQFPEELKQAIANLPGAMRQLNIDCRPGRPLEACDVAELDQLERMAEVGRDTLRRLAEDCRNEKLDREQQKAAEAREAKALQR